MNSAYLKPPFTPSNLDRYVARQAILDALTAQLKHLHGTLLDVGCGHQPYRPLLLAPPSRVVRYIGLDVPGNIYASPELYWDGARIPLSDDTVDCAVATEVLEHVPEPEPLLREICRVLKPGGSLFLTVPFLWPLHDVPHDEYRYTPFALERLLSSAGFERIDLKAMGGWDASLAQLVGLWTRRRPLSHLQRDVVSAMAFPAVWLLLKQDEHPDAFEERCMITGISGTATKPFPDHPDLSSAVSA